MFKRQTGDLRFLVAVPKLLAASIGLTAEGERRAKIRLGEKNAFTIAGMLRKT